MAKLKLELSDKTVLEKVQLLRQVVLKMTGNANFTTPTPALANLTSLANQLETDLNNRDAAEQTAAQLTTVLATTELMANAALTAEANYVEGIAMGDETKLLSSGMDLRDEPAPVGELPAPTDLSLKAGSNDGELKAKWERVRKSQSYLIQLSEDPMTPATWEQAGTSTKASYKATGLVSGKKYWMRVCAIGSAGQGPWSDPAVKVAP